MECKCCLLSKRGKLLVLFIMAKRFTSYEEEQKYLQEMFDKYMDMSDEEVDDPFAGDNSESDYVPSESESECSEQEQPIPKKSKLTEKYNAIQSSATTSHIDDAIDSVIFQTNNESSEDTNDDDEELPTGSQFTWTTVTGRNLKVFDFNAVNSGIAPAVAASLAQKNLMISSNFFLLTKLSNT